MSANTQAIKLRWCGAWAERPEVVPEGVSHSTPSLGDINPTLDELKALLGTTLVIEATTPGTLAAQWMSPSGEQVRWVAGHPTLTLVVLDLFASRTESDLGLPVNRIWRDQPNCPE